MRFEGEREEFLRLLDDECGEQTYQSFMEQHTRFIPRDFEQNHGIHLSLVLRKLSFGSGLQDRFFLFFQEYGQLERCLYRDRKALIPIFQG